MLGVCWPPGGSSETAHPASCRRPPGRVIPQALPFPLTGMLIRDGRLGEAVYLGTVNQIWVIDVSLET